MFVRGGLVGPQQHGLSGEQPGQSLQHGPELFIAERAAVAELYQRAMGQEIAV